MQGSFPDLRLPKRGKERWARDGAEGKVVPWMVQGNSLSVLLWHVHTNVMATWVATATRWWLQSKAGPSTESWFTPPSHLQADTPDCGVRGRVDGGGRRALNCCPSKSAYQTPESWLGSVVTCLLSKYKWIRWSSGGGEKKMSCLYEALIVTQPQNHWNTFFCRHKVFRWRWHCREISKNSVQRGRHSSRARSTAETSCLLLLLPQLFEPQATINLQNYYYF